MTAQIGDNGPSVDVRRALAARARETLADMARTYEQIMAATPQESCEWLKTQVDQVTALRTRPKGGRGNEQDASE